MSLKKFDAIVISGGGIKGICSLGALQYEYEKTTYDYDNVKIYAGTSIGAIICLLLICGYTPIDAFIKIHEIEDFFDIKNSETSVDLWDFTKLMGLMSIKGFIDKIELIIKEKIGFIPTLKELKILTGKTLIVSATNVSKMSCEYYTYKTRPHLSCIDAIKFSSNLPLIFQRLQYNNSYITDGGVIDNFPLNYIDNGKINILGIVSTEITETKAELNFYEYFYRLFTLPIISNTKLRCDMIKSNTKLIQIKNNSFLPFKVSEDDKMDMFSLGFNEAKMFDEIVYLKCKNWDDNIHDILL